MTDAQEEFAEQVLGVVDHIPVGRVMTYGDIAEYLQRGGPRGVGGVMAREGAAVAWWRVVRANGTLPAHLVIDAQEHWHLERTPLRRGIVDVDAARWWPEADERAAR
ncbi:MGMT family protein [Rhodococcoides corynebacterioides]|uniref:MGMT family protein n=1 Tax=Rhodococcoides corynebacterioides TaxID=53972 RepID=A0ABS7P7S4_9NOCA|nr:MGMT family protein [Rhodococcus corynebacterioides]MBY6368473.1 MGMT family protein [Rhodococcus corynebacterioides]MBY6409330.1 MGMT family protein [Rhodococcus corynebacterioides]